MARCRGSVPGLFRYCRFWDSDSCGLEEGDGGGGGRWEDEAAWVVGREFFRTEVCSEDMVEREKSICVI